MQQGCVISLKSDRSAAAAPEERISSRAAPQPAMAGMSGGFGGSSVSQTKRDINLQQGSKDDRWQICETCLGPNPFVRMMKLPMSRECKISTRPYTAFRFRPGKEARWKETIICYEVAVAKNVCQVCLFDMQFQLPTAVIDKYMRDKGEGGAAEQAAQSGETD